MTRYQLTDKARAQAVRAHLRKPMVQVSGPAPVRTPSPAILRAIRIVERAEIAVQLLGASAVIVIGILSVVHP